MGGTCVKKKKLCKQQGAREREQQSTSLGMQASGRKNNQKSCKEEERKTAINWCCHMHLIQCTYLDTTRWQIKLCC